MKLFTLQFSFSVCDLDNSLLVIETAVDKTIVTRGPSAHEDPVIQLKATEQVNE